MLKANNDLEKVQKSADAIDGRKERNAKPQKKSFRAD